MTEICPSCNGLGRIFSNKTVASKIDRWLHRASADGEKIPSPMKIFVSHSIFDYIERNNLQEEFQRSYRKKLVFDVLPHLEQDEFEIHVGENDEDITEKHL